MNGAAVIPSDDRATRPCLAGIGRNGASWSGCAGSIPGGPPSPMIVLHPQGKNSMELPLQITFRHMDSSDAVAARIRERAEELERFFDRIMSCRVVVECRHPRHQQGNLFRIRVDLKVPGREIVVGRDPAAHHAHEDPYVAVRGSFDAARRLLEDYVHERRGDVKLHAVPDHGRVARLIAEQDYGFITTPDGSEIYFHRNSVTNGGFDK